MADYVLVRKSRNIISSVLHVVLNILLGVGSVAITVITGSWYIGLTLVLLSKWRIFAVRPRFWWVNIKSNLVDLIVGASFVFITYCSGTDWQLIHTILTIAYPIWLIAIKPRSTDFFAEFQSLCAVFFGTTATTMLFASSNSALITVLCFIIGYSATRHILIQSDDDADTSLINLSCGLISAEAAWVGQSWLIVYSFANTGILIPQLAIILTIITFATSRVYKSAIKHDGKPKFSEISSSTIFSILVVAIIILWFSRPIFNF